MKRVEVVQYDPEWPELFAQLRERLLGSIGQAVLTIEHIGSTAVPGLATKPVIDLDVVIENQEAAAEVTAGLEALGYTHRGNLGIEGREAFRRPPGTAAHHLYLCERGSLPLRNHLAIRDYLRANPAAAQEYGELKQTLAARYPTDIDAYMRGKAPFLLNVLSMCGMQTRELDQIAAENQIRLKGS